MSGQESQSDHFVEFMGLTLQADGFSKIAGRIFGLLLISDRPLTADEICDRLQISRGSVSTNCRMLESLDVVERTSVAGDRKDYFKVPADPFSQFVRGQAHRLRKHCRRLDDFIQDPPTDDPEARERLHLMRRFWGLALQDAEDLAKELSQRKRGPRTG